LTKEREPYSSLNKQNVTIFPVLCSIATSIFGIACIAGEISHVGAFALAAAQGHW